MPSFVKIYQLVKRILGVGEGERYMNMMHHE